ncbi:TfoX/Sxy family protein [uncultured Oscillibacter sp.]|uniref:TfoX/Sxy family protein n=2 Tax=uncultured Oscillibacter sp. TaxID=876091 RepID=UPI00261DA7E6|nr:TfoX/Sxy family protein [uncultured Oscillibacter sp.]
MPDLTSMRNIGAEMARKLAAVGIRTPEELKEAGAKGAFFRLKTLYPSVCLVHLYALEGAVRGVEFNALSPEDKADLKEFSGALKGKGGSPR